MSIDHYLFRAQAALSALGHLACYRNNSGNMPPEDFGFGLSVILGHIGDDVRAAYDKYTEPEEKAE